MSVPGYCDLGRAFKDVFSTGFAFDLFKFKIGKPIKDVKAEIDGNFNFSSQKTVGGLSTKYNTDGYGNLMAKYSNAGPLVGEYSLNGVVHEAVDVSAGVSYNVPDSFHSVSLVTKFHNSMLHAGCGVTIDSDRSPDLVGSAVVKLQNFLVGYQSGFDTNTSRVTRNNVAVVMDVDNVAFHLRCLQIPREIGLSGLYRVNENLSVAFDAKMAKNEVATLWTMGAGLAMKLDDTTKLRVKMDKGLNLATSLQLKPMENAQLTLAFSLDCTNPTHGNHKFGLGIEMEA
ncbi:hypothetical protein TKK_0013214 [Trichogramma kaykai]